MQLILTQDVAHLGQAGELVSVRAGYGRNFLLPKGMAVLATSRNVKQLEHDRRMISARVAKETAAAEQIASRLNGMTLQFERRVGDDDKMFGSVTARNIADQLEVAGLDIDHRRIALSEPVKSLGKYEVDIRLKAGVTATLKFWVVGKED
ncbi:50S ribosomal protein L9 [Haliangium ochraceum]|uniref:Large ribosomal subunit protein bL9 n=1 Tax=Haliangium ochraceum (strain DSM 14365 / JCM 11303 / SMP-2) TaxID=502025 RepID=D0LPW2_HALO1|nr:50S ribosomal protein L9 [Haliangium ochraceum]ACY16999.1 ribosomal protein L9 [Haliangium ochraceum DSM 14365]